MMLRNALLVVGVVLVCHPSCAEERLDSLRVGSRVYRNVVVLDVNETDIYFKHDSGVVNEKLKYLDPELQKRFGYDPDKSVRAEKLQEDLNQQFGESLALALQSEAFWRAHGPATLGEASLADPVSERSLINQPAPELVVEKWIGPKPDLRSRFIIVLFWSAASIPCQRVIPELNSLQKKFADQLAIVGIAPQTEEQIAQMTESKIEFYIASDPNSKLANLAGVTSIPQILLIDSKNIVRYQGHPAAVNEKVLQDLFAKYAGE